MGIELLTVVGYLDFYSLGHHRIVHGVGLPYSVKIMEDSELDVEFRVLFPCM